MWKMPTLKFGHLWPKSLDLPLGKKSREMKVQGFGQKWPNFKVGIFHMFMSLGISACRWESVLSANNAPTKKFLFNSHPDFKFCGLFLCPCSLERPKTCLRGRFQPHWFDWKLLKEHLYFVQKSTFFQEVSPEILVKDDHIFKSAFFTCKCP